MDTLKKYWNYFIAGLGAIFGVLFLLQRSKTRSLEDKLQKAERDKVDFELIHKEETIKENIKEIKDNIQKEESEPVRVDDLSPKDVEEYWK